MGCISRVASIISYRVSVWVFGCNLESSSKARLCFWSSGFVYVCDGGEYEALWIR